MIQPRFQHDCKDCYFLGHTNEGKADMYFCEKGNRFPTVIVRHSNEDGDYSSGLMLARNGTTSLSEAMQAAVDANLISMDQIDREHAKYSIRS